MSQKQLILHLQKRLTVIQEKGDFESAQDPSIEETTSLIAKCKTKKSMKDFSQISFICLIDIDDSSKTNSQNPERFKSEESQMSYG